MSNKECYATLNLNLLKSKKSKIISSQEALAAVTPIDWDNEVLAGKRKIVIGKKQYWGGILCAK